MHPLRLNDNMSEDMDMDQVSLLLQLRYSPKDFDDRMWHSAREEKSHDLSEIGAGALDFRPRPRRVQDDSSESPWRVEEDSSSDRNTAANDNRNFAFARESETRLGNTLVMDSAHRSFPLQPNSCFPTFSTTSASPPCHAFDQSVGDINQISQQEPPSRCSLVSAGRRRKSGSTEEETDRIMLVQEMENCGICRERNVRVSLCTRR